MTFFSSKILNRFQCITPEPRRAPYLEAVLRIAIRYLVPFRPLDPGSGMGKKQDPDPEWTTRIIFPRAWNRNQCFELKYLNYLMRIGDGKNSDPWSGIRDKIPDPQHWCPCWKSKYVFFYSRTDTKEYALKMIEGAGLSMSACREIALLR
jgi:hypothetical protein